MHLSFLFNFFILKKCVYVVFIKFLGFNTTILIASVSTEHCRAVWRVMNIIIYIFVPFRFRIKNENAFWVDNSWLVVLSND